MSLSLNSYNVFKGSVFKELVKTLLEDCGYTTAPYGYENQFSTTIRSKLIRSESDTAKRIRCSPDLLVYDPDKNEIFLVEVKMCSYETPQIPRIKLYKQYWNDAIILYVAPCHNVFYAEEIDKLGIKPFYKLSSDFRRVQDIFPKTDIPIIEEYRNLANKLIETMKIGSNEGKDSIE